MEEHEYYPEKPLIEKVKVESNWGLTAFSIVLFVGVFLLVFNDQLQFVLFLISLLHSILLKTPSGLVLSNIIFLFFFAILFIK